MPSANRDIQEHSYLITKEENIIMPLQAKEHWGMLEAGRGSLRSFGGNGLAKTLISEFRFQSSAPRTLRKWTPGVLNHPGKRKVKIVLYAYLYLEKYTHHLFTLFCFCLFFFDWLLQTLAFTSPFLKPNGLHLRVQI